MRLLVTGGRYYAQSGFLFAVLDAIHRKHGVTVLIHGATPTKTGADWLADEWAKKHDVAVDPYPVDTAIDGPWPDAGPKRNGRMIIESKPDFAVAFPGSKKSPGTRNCVAQLKAAGIKVWIPKERPVHAKNDNPPDAADGTVETGQDPG